MSAFSDKDSPFTIGAVCRRWRHIAWSSPYVWSIFTMVVPRPHISETRIQLAKEYLSRSGRLPLSINVRAHSFDNSAPGIAQFYPLIDIINQYSSRWRQLYLSLPSSLFALLTFSSASSLLDVDLDCLDEDKSSLHTLLPILPPVVETQYLHLDPPSMNWTQVTHFTTSLLKVDQVLQILRLGPCLRECVFCDIRFREVDSPDQAFAPVTHPLLESLRVSLNFDDSEGLFFSKVTLPALQHFQVESSDFDPLYHDHLASFLTRSSQLRSLKLLEADFDDPEHVLVLLRATPSLEKLQIPYGSAMENYLAPFYHALSCHLPTNENPIPDFTEPLLPSLRVFDWFGENNFSWDVLPGFLVPLSQCNNDRRRPLEKISIRCGRKGDPTPYIDEVVLSKLLPFVHEVQFQLEAPVTLPNGHEEIGDLWEMSLKKIKSNPTQTT
ncbi:hypothetical protein CPB84DRAFT_1851688 [Gymnopilus junonius]|uniref:F-box domain-containing protein n=1 Tax=Gymnopilus junonius TaxID=109634 RepID=A0A9P5NEP9_GYMJU|nr:hypothetical protein CPB84DRAFT_1851688 [Gymnopilus junonius]